MGAEAVERNQLDAMEGRNIRELRSDKDMAEEHGNNVLSFEAGQIRKDLLERMNREKGVISDDERETWQKKMGEADQDVSHLRSIKDEFEDQWRESIELRKRFDKRVHGAEEEGMLRHGEHDQLDDTFTKSKLEQKEKMLAELEKELEGRQKELGRFLKLEKSVQGKRRESLEGAEDYDEKLKVVEAAEHENQHFQEFKQIFDKHSDKIGKKTRSEYFDWFLTLSDNEQHDATAKAEKKDIQPRVDAWEIHNGLPKEYQQSGFLDWGLSRREQYLGEVERRADREWRTSLRESKGVLAEKSIDVLQKEYEKAKGDQGKRLNRKISFAEMLGKQVEMEGKLWKQFEKVPEVLHAWLEKEFAAGDFEERKDLLEKKVPKLTERYSKSLNRMNNKIDAHISEAYRDSFEDAPSIDVMEKMVTEAEKFQKSKDSYFKKWKAAAKYFHSDPAVYEKWYEESVNSLEAAQKAERDLDPMIIDRKKVYDGMQKLPPHLRSRMSEDDPFERRGKDLSKLQEVAKAYESAIPFLLKNAQEREKEKDPSGALGFYMEALKLDPDSVELKTLAAHLRQQGATLKSKPSGPEDETKTQAIMKEIDGAPQITGAMAELAQHQILLDLAKKHKEHVGATGSTTEARAEASLKSLDNEDKENARILLDKHEDDFTVDEKGTVRKKIKVKTDGTRSDQINNQLGQLFGNKVHRGEAAQTGLSEIGFIGQDGKEMEQGTAQKQADEMKQDLAANYEAMVFSRLRATNVDFTPKQMDALKKALDLKAHVDDEFENTKKAA